MNHTVRGAFNLLLSLHAQLVVVDPTTSGSPAGSDQLAARKSIFLEKPIFHNNFNVICPVQSHLQK
jgi:hypothetical protein